MKRPICRILAAMLALSILFGAAMAEESGGETVPEAAEKPVEARDLIRTMIDLYASGGTGEEARVQALLGELSALDRGAGERWTEIMGLWRGILEQAETYESVLPDGLPETDELCIAVLGFHLEPDGSMREELLGRLNAALASARKYPNALIVCTGGPTASDHPEVTEAGQMAAWLIGQGVDSGRVIAEGRSMSTVQNAIYTMNLLIEKYPQVTSLAVISSDYHVPAGALLFGAEAVLLAGTKGARRIRVVAGAAYPVPDVPLFSFRMLVELARREEPAFGTAPVGWDTRGPIPGGRE